MLYYIPHIVDSHALSTYLLVTDIKQEPTGLTMENTEVNSARSHYVLAVLLLAYILSFVDRNINTLDSF